MTLRDACSAYLQDASARNRAPGTQCNYRSLFRGLQEFARSQGVDSLSGIDRARLRIWRQSWGVKASTARQRLQMLRAFFSFAVSEGWIEESPARGIGLPKSDSPPTMPLDVAEVSALLDACAHRPKERALILLMRYSGLSIGDAVSVARDSLDSRGDLVLRRSKTGVLVTVALPSVVLEALGQISEPGRQYFFWSGTSDLRSVAGYWRGRLRRVAVAAGIDNFRPHRLRDTFATELLLADVAMDDVATLLGHQSVSITERYYAAWCTTRRDRLRDVVTHAHRRDPILLAFREGKPAATAATAAAGEGLATAHVSRPPRLRHGST